VTSNRVLVPYVLLGILTLGAGLGAGLALAAGPITDVPTQAVALTLACSESFGGSSLYESSSPTSKFQITSSNSSSSKPHCVVSGAGSKSLDRCLSTLASARGTMTPTLPQRQIAECENQFGRSGGGTITFARPPNLTAQKDWLACVAKGMRRDKLSSVSAMQRVFTTVVSVCERQAGLPKP
jgi:hypothetical protein